VKVAQARPLLIVDSVTPALSGELEAQVAAIWSAERKRRSGTLFDGLLFSLNRDTTDLRGYLVSYRRFLAQQVRPELRGALSVRPVGVTGVLSCPDGVIIAQRADTVTMDAGRWELAPSGGVDGSTVATSGLIDPSAQVLSELEEEIGLKARDLEAAPCAFAIAEDPESRVTDIAYEIRTALPFRTIVDRFRSIPRREYTALAVLPARRGYGYGAEGVALTVLSEALVQCFAMLPAAARE
jgi:hypothetical protein